jgi:hypothetical protein
VNALAPSWLPVLENDLSEDQELLSIEILKVMSNSDQVSKPAVDFSYRMLKGKNERGKEAARNYLMKFNKPVEQD